MKPSAAVQLSFLDDVEPGALSPGTHGKTDRLGVTFRDSKVLPVHRWYPYVEGFSATYLRTHLTDVGPNGCVYDPFGGSGTVNLEASNLGISSFFSEVNPFMRFVAETKLSARFQARRSKAFTAAVARFRKFLTSERIARDAGATPLNSYHLAFRNRDFFVEKDLRQLLAAKEQAIKIADGATYIRDLLLLAISSVVVSSSNMTRRADLRRRGANEYVGRVVDVPRFILQKLDEIERDTVTSSAVFAPTHFLGPDARDFDKAQERQFSLILTSPPYLNGTNYIRNTKLELWFLNFIESEADLSSFTKKSIVCGINNVIRSRQPAHQFDCVEQVACKLDRVSPDLRIPALVRGYCSDMADVLRNCRSYLRDDGRMVLDIGDSQFYGVHVPTDIFIEKIAENVGFRVARRTVIARRHSHDKTPLHQVELVLRPSVNGHAFHFKLAAKKELITKSSIAAFEKGLPHTLAPYNKRNWGHSLHSLCSYQGKLKPSLAHWVVKQFTDSGDLVLDPLGGVGTIAFEAALEGRPGAISSDLSPFPALVAAAKLAPPTQDELTSALRRFEQELQRTSLTKGDLLEAEFGLNATVRDYFHRDTLREVLAARKMLMKKAKLSQAEKFIFACLLHILHGNRPYALSRCSHPITPFSPTGPTEYRSLVGKLRERCLRIVEHALPPTFAPGIGLQSDFRDLHRHLDRPVDVIITSPPFPGLRFDRPNWMRMWFCGWSASDFHVTSRAFLERQQLEDMNVYRDFFVSCASLLRPGGSLIMHIGGSRSYDMLETLKSLARDQFSLLGDVAEDVSDVEKHGIRDKGRTDKHHLLFFKFS